MFSKGFSLLLLISALYVKNADHQLRHEADSDELRSAAEESAEGLREHHAWQKSRKPDTHSAG
mgnify:CR=1 FL=1